MLAHDPATARTVNAGTAWRTHPHGFIDSDAGIEPSLAVHRPAPQSLPLPIDLLERHPGSPQVFAALTVTRFLVVVAPAGPDGSPDPAGARAFIGERGTALCHARGQWHPPMVALDAGGDMVMIAFERGRGDTVEHRLDSPLLVVA